MILIKPHFYVLSSRDRQLTNQQQQQQQQQQQLKRNLDPSWSSNALVDKRSPLIRSTNPGLYIMALIPKKPDRFVNRINFYQS